jgi:manganese-dependent inorganic pyrophosphatase
MSVRPIYVTGHRNPDTDSISSAIGYAELLARTDDDNEYVAVRLGEVNAQTRWVLGQAGLEEPRYLPHVFLRVRDVMRERFSRAGAEDPVRQVGLTMAQEGLDFVPVVDDDGALAGVVTERELARRYIRESREASSLVDMPTQVGAIVDTLDGDLIVGDADATVEGRVWVFAMDGSWKDSGIRAGDVVVVGNREDAHRRVIETGVALVVFSNGVAPSDEIVAMARERGTALVVSSLDSYVCGRMITLAAPCRGLMDDDPLTVRPDDLLSDVAEIVKDVHYRAAIATDRGRTPIGIVARADLVNPAPRRVLLVDHAEQAQSVPGIEHAEIVEILDHHHIGSIETRVPVPATFDPVGSTATLVLERFQQQHLQPSRPAATALLGAILSDTVILNSPTTTRRDRSAVEHLERVLGVEAEQFGREMFEAGSDVEDASVEAILNRDAKEYEVSGGIVSIAQVETVGPKLDERLGELLDGLRKRQQRDGAVMSALMVTDVLEHGTTLLVAGEHAAVERAFGKEAEDGVVELPGVMSRKKEVAPRLLSAL